MLMNTMEALGAGQSLSPKGEAPGLNLGADAETLALFASLFAMMQTPQPGSADNAEIKAGSQATQMQPGSEDGKPPLPAAAMLMAELAPAAEIADKTMLPGEAGAGEGDAAALLKLLLAAQDIAAPDHQPTTAAPDNDAGINPVAPARTATEMLTGAIEILKALETAPQLQAPDMAPAADDLPEEPAPMVLASPSPEFVGPMPAVTTQTISSAPAVVVLADPDFIGLLPEAESSVALPLSAVVLHADPDFIGPMPTAIQTIAAAPAVVTTTIAAPSPDFVGPMPAIRSILNAAHNSPDATIPVPDTAMDDTGQTKDEGFVRQRADMFAAGKGMTEKTAEQKMAADMQATRMAAMRAGAETSQASSTSTSASGLAQQMAASLSGQASSGQDTAQAAANTAANTAGGQGGTSSGGHSGGQPGGQPGGQQSAQQMADGGLARGTADRTLLHRLNTDNAGWSETMVKRLSADLRSGVQKVRIILEPRQLGRLNVELGVRDGRASIRIAAETQEAARLLSGARGQLGQMLENAGMRLASFQATGSQAGDAGLDNGQGSQGRGGEGAGDQDARNNAGRNQEFSNKVMSVLDEHADDKADGDDLLRDGETAVLSILA